MQFRTPQFIDVEDKIFGPFTFKQFLYLAGGAGMCFVLYKALPFLIAVIPILFVGGMALALTFVKVNNKPFVNALQSYITFSLQNKLYIWKKEPKKIVKKEIAAIPQAQLPRLSESKLKDIAWSLDVLDRATHNNQH